MLTYAQNNNYNDDNDVLQKGNNIIIKKAKIASIKNISGTTLEFANSNKNIKAGFEVEFEGQRSKYPYRIESVVTKDGQHCGPSINPYIYFNEQFMPKTEIKGYVEFVNGLPTLTDKALQTVVGKTVVVLFFKRADKDKIWDLFNFITADTSAAIESVLTAWNNKKQYLMDKGYFTEERAEKFETPMIKATFNPTPVMTHQAENPPRAFAQQAATKRFI